MSSQQLLQQLLDLQKVYANTYRSAVTAERLKYGQSGKQPVDVSAENIREPLLEHVGHLPIIASFLYLHLRYKNEINLGRVLIMLSIHDIGETVTGDFFSFKKNSQQDLEEITATRKLLPKELISYFEEFELRESVDAKYAKAVDALAPCLHELTIPEITKKRFAAIGFDSRMINDKKRKFFDWDNVLNDMFSVLIEAYQKMERDEPTGFLV